MKTIMLLILGLILASAPPAFAVSSQEVTNVDGEESNLRVTEPVKYDHDGYDTFVEVVFLRPLGLVTTVVGTGLFIGLSPFTAFASFAPPHDAFKWMGDGLIVRPARYTFKRPLGDFAYRSEYKAN